MESVNHPKHYNSLGAKCSKCDHDIECIDVVRHMSFNAGNVVKYLWRAGHKGNAIEDLNKALFYIQDDIRKTNKKDICPHCNNYIIERFLHICKKV